LNEKRQQKGSALSRGKTLIGKKKMIDRRRKSQYSLKLKIEKEEQ